MIGNIIQKGSGGNSGGDEFSFQDLQGVTITLNGGGSLNIPKDTNCSFLVPQATGNMFLSNYTLNYPNNMSESQFLSLLKYKIYDAKYLGYRVNITNSYVENRTSFNMPWIIADVNHDSANTGQTNCYDLISEKVYSFYYGGGSYNTYPYIDTSVRTLLNSTFYNCFSEDIKSHILNIKYNSNGTWYTNDKVVPPSFAEVNGTIDKYQSSFTAPLEGVPYPIFTGASTRRTTSVTSSSYISYLLRTDCLYTYSWGGTQQRWCSVIGYEIGGYEGYMSSVAQTGSASLRLIIRVQ